MFKLKEKNKLCRKYMQDIWGNMILKKKLNKVLIYLLKLKHEKLLRYKPRYLDIKIARPLKRRRARSRFCKNLDLIKFTELAHHQHFQKSDYLEFKEQTRVLIESWAIKGDFK